LYSVFVAFIGRRIATSLETVAQID